MRFGIAIDLHATAAEAPEVTWERIRDLVMAAERRGLDLISLPDHLAYRAGSDGGEGDYVVEDAAVGVRESTTIAAAVAAVTSTIGIAHSVVNAPYRTPTMVAHIAASLADVSGGRYSLGIGVGNSFDYEQLGVAADRRVARFEECVEIVSSLLHDGHADLEGRHWSAERAALTLRPDPRPPVIVAAGGPRTMRTAVRFGDGWNGWFATDPTGDDARERLDLLERSCVEADRDPSTMVTTADLAVDPLDLQGARARSIETLGKLADLGIDEVRCYTLCGATAVARLEALEAYADMTGQF